MSGAHVRRSREGDARRRRTFLTWGRGGGDQVSPPLNDHASAGSRCWTAIGPFPCATWRAKTSRICDSEKRCA